MFGWIPIVGPIIDGIVSIWKGYQNVDIAKYTVDGKVDIAAMQASSNIIATTKDDIGIRLARDILIYPVVIWTSIISWDNIIKHVTWHHLDKLFLTVEKFPPSVEYLPYAVITFLLGNIGLNMWSRR